MPTTHAAAAAPRWGKVLLCAAPGVLLTIACLVPFLNKAYTVDDPLLLYEAEQILKTPLRPLNFEICWNSVEKWECAPANRITPNTASMGYALVPVVLAGGSERLAHTLQLLLASLAVIAMASLALWFGYGPGQAAAAGLLLAATPPFLSMANTVMSDNLALCCGLVGMERLAAWRSGRKWHRAAAAGIALGIGMFARPQIGLLLPIGALYLFDGKDPRAWLGQLRRAPLRWMPIAIGAATAAVLFLATRQPGMPLMPGKLMAAHHLSTNVAAYFVYLAFPLPFAIPWILLHARKSPWLLVAAPTLAGLAWTAKHFLKTLSDPMPPDRWLLLGVPFTAVALLHVFQTAWVRRELRLLVPALWILIPLPAVIYPHFPIKYLLPISPAVILLLLDGGRRISNRAAIAATVLLVAGGTAYSIALLRADSRFSNLARQAVQELVTPNVQAGRRVWSATQWGLQWYSNKAGGITARPDSPEAKAGDLLVVGQVEGSETALAQFPKRTLLRVFSETCDCGRTVGKTAGLYTDYYTFMLWSWGTGEINRYELWQID